MSAPRTEAVLLVVLCLFAIALRVALFPVLGYPPDMGLFAHWLHDIAAQGLSVFPHLAETPAKYFPNYASVFLLIAGLARISFFQQFLLRPDAAVLFFKSLSLLGDLLCAGAIAGLVVSPAAKRTRLSAAIHFLLLPGCFLATAWWGQIDSLHTAFVLLAFLAVFRRRPTLGACLFVLALCTKLHSIAFLPVFLVALWTHTPHRTFWLRVLPASVMTFFLLTLPLLLQLSWQERMLGVMGSVSKFPFLTMNALNFWWPVARAIGGMPRDDEPYPLFALGFFLFAIAMIAIVHFARKHPTQKQLLAAAALSGAAFFFLPTQMHERYLFPFFAFALVLAAHDAAWTRWSWVLSIGFAINLLMAGQTPLHDWFFTPYFGMMPLLDIWPFVFGAGFFALALGYAEGARGTAGTQ